MNVTTLAAAAPPTPAAWRVVAQAGYYLALCVAAGSGLTLAVLARPERDGGLVAGRVRRLLPRFAAFVAVAATLQYVAAVAEATKGRAASLGLAAGLRPSAIGDFVMSGPGRGGGSLGAGVIPTAQLGVFAVLVLIMLGAARTTARGWAWAVLGAAVAVGAVPNVPTGSPTVNGVAKDVLTEVHVIGASLWVGGLIVLAVVGLSARRERPGRHRSAAPVSAADDWARVWSRYSAVALYAVGALLISGAWLAWSHVGTVGQLFTTPYGRYLAIKLVLVLCMLAGGAFNMKVLLPRIAAARTAGEGGSVAALAIRHFPVVVSIEAALGTAVLCVVPFLQGSARSEAGGASARPFDLTVFATGVVLAALVVLALWAGSRVRVPAARSVLQD